MAEETKPTARRSTKAAAKTSATGETKAPRKPRASAKTASASATSAAQAATAKLASQTEAWREQAGEFADQALNTARSAATTAKNSTGTALHGLSKLINDTAETVESRLGPQYGDYARQAAETVAGAAKSLDEKDVDQLAKEARDFVREKPAVAIGAAAVLGFVVMRMFRGGDREG